MVPQACLWCLQLFATLVLGSFTDWLLLCMYVYETFLTNFGALYLSKFLMDLGQILNSKSYDQA